jgi:hypothetical protein
MSERDRSDEEPKAPEDPTVEADETEPGPGDSEGARPEPDDSPG